VNWFPLRERLERALVSGSRLWCGRSDHAGAICARVGHFAFSGKSCSGLHTSFVERIVPMPVYDRLHFLRWLLRLRFRSSFVEVCDLELICFCQRVALGVRPRRRVF
jgi:hypothetical protein